jgi:hypothetical protein
MLTPMLTSLVLPYVKSERKWTLLAARTSKSLSAFLDMEQHHWESRYKNLLARLRSGRARFEIQRRVHCYRRDPFYWDNDSNLNGFGFTVSVIQPHAHSFARQAVPQLRQIMRIMGRWNRGGETEVTFTGRRKMGVVIPFVYGCRKTHFIGAIPIHVAWTPTEPMRGNLYALADWMDSQADEEDGYDTESSWACECGETHSESAGW